MTQTRGRIFGVSALALTFAAGLASPVLAQEAATPPMSEAETRLDAMLMRWTPFTLLLNSLTRSLGQIDAYPFALSVAAQRKMRFVHDVICERRLNNAALQFAPPTQNLPVSDT